jgi:hypothetical protein
MQGLWLGRSGQNKKCNQKEQAVIFCNRFHGSAGISSSSQAVTGWRRGRDQPWSAVFQNQLLFNS